MGFTKPSDHEQEDEEDVTGKPADRIDPDDHHSLTEYENHEEISED